MPQSATVNRHIVLNVYLGLLNIGRPMRPSSSQPPSALCARWSACWPARCCDSASQDAKLQAALDLNEIRWLYPLYRLDRLPVHKRLSVLDLDEHGPEPAFPQVAQHAFTGEWQVGLGAVVSTDENFWQQRCIHGEQRFANEAFSRPTRADRGDWSEPGPDAAQPDGCAVGSGLIELAVGRRHDVISCEAVLYLQPVLYATTVKLPALSTRCFA